MNANTKLSCAIVAILGGSAAGAAYAQTTTTTAPSAEPADQIQTIIVTAQRRTESIQDVPISIQAFTGQTLKQLNVTTFDDYIKYLPSVSAASNGPGQNEIFMRGLSAGVQPSQGSGSTGLFPNVAIYLDDQSGQLPNRNLDIYAADLDRIEVLEGPQGTLFGAGAQAGTVRYITNKPKLNATEGNVDAGYGVTAHGDPNTNLTAVLNVPLIADTLAVRGVIYSDRRGGYIDNVPGTFTRMPTDIGIHYANFPGGGVPPNAPAINNNSIAARAINPVTYQGMRAEALFQINDDWNVLLSQMYQNMDSQGVFYQTPKSSDGATLHPLETTLFNNAYDKDRFENTAWTVNGKFGVLKAVYTGGYLVRHVDQIGDYTNYSRGTYADYYQCYGPGSGGDATLTSTCFSPHAAWRTAERNEHMQHEIRVSTPDEWRLRGIVGAYYEDNKLFDRTAWMYKSIPPCTSNGAPGTPGNTGCLSNVGTFPGTSVESPGVQNDNTSFYQDTRRRTKQTAVFASLDLDLIPKVLILTLGTRHFRFENSSQGSVSSSFNCFEQGTPAGGCHNPLVSYNLDAQNLTDTESGYKSRGNLTWHMTPDMMLYYTFSQGFRPGGFNQSGGAKHAFGPDGQPQYVTPRSYHSDDLTNNEIGWKTEFFNHRLQWNGAVYRENWNNVQVAFFDPGLIGNIFFNTNGQNFLVKGIETSIVARVMEGLTVQGGGSWNQSRQTNSPALIDANPQSINFGKPITVSCTSAGTNCTPITNPFGPIGAPSANSPPIQFSLRARYEWSLADYSAFVQVGATHTGHSFTQAGSNPTIAASGTVSTGRLRFEDPAYTTYDASLGVAKDAWNVHGYVQNLSNSNASVFTNTDQFIVAQTVLRPRVIGVAFGYKF
ncbi:MAG: TonB-dependent receptor [Steroidobacteraceae bacterium]